MASEDVLLKLFRLLYELPANPIVDELQDSFEALAAEVRELRKDKARLDWMLRNTNDDILSRVDLDAAMGETQDD